MDSGNMRGQVPQPKQINNAALAIVLHICGVPFVKTDGVTIPGFNLYTDPILKQHGWEGKSRTLAVQSLFAKGIPGQVIYQFERVPGSTLMEEIVEGWDNMSKAIQNADTAHPDATAATLATDIPAASVAAICCQFAKTRREFFGDKNTIPLWRRRDAKGNLFIPACKAPEGPGRMERDGDKTIFYGSMELRSVKV